MTERVTDLYGFSFDATVQAQSERMMCDGIDQRARRRAAAADRRAPSAAAAAARSHARASASRPAALRLSLPPAHRTRPSGRRTSRRAACPTWRAS